MATELSKFAPLYSARGVTGDGKVVRLPSISAVMHEAHVVIEKSPNPPFPINIAQMISAMNHNRSRDSRKEPEFADIPPDVEMTQTLTREEVMFRMMTRISEGRTYKATELASLVDNYPIGLFVKSKESAIEMEGILKTADKEDIKGTMSYVLPRFVNSTHFQNLNNAEVHFTDDVEQFYADTSPKFVPNNRSRVYSIQIDKTGKSTITFLLRHNIKENYTDAFELISFMGFIETAREYVKTNKATDMGYMVETLEKGQGLTLSKSKEKLAKPWEVSNTPEMIPSAMQDVVSKIKRELSIIDCETPGHVMFGNDFSVPLLIGTGVIEPDEFQYIKSVAEKESRESRKMNKIVSEEEIKGLFKSDDKEIMRQFSMLQYLNRYTGNDSTMKQMQIRLENATSSVRKRIIQPTHTALGSYVDIIDFTNLTDKIVENIDNSEIRNIVRDLKKQKFRYYSLPYPLGDSIHGLTYAFKKELGVTNFGFFGKVGAVPVEGSKVARGRVVMPEKTTVMSVQKWSDRAIKGIRDYPNILSGNDVVIISNADPHKVVVSVNGLTLQSLKDLPRLKKLIREIYGGLEYSDLLLDMEAAYFNEACISLGVVPAAIYYVSDLTKEKTPDPYAVNMDGNGHTIINALGAEGTLASLVSPFTILKKWVHHMALVSML